MKTKGLPYRTVYRRRGSLIGAIAVGAVVSLVLISCGDQPLDPTPIKVTLLPAEVPAICVGETTRLEASVVGYSNRTVRWRSRSPLVASVDSMGVVLGLAPGTAPIVAMAAADSLARDSVTVNVGAIALFYNNPTVWFSGVKVHNTGNAVDPANVSGLIDVYIEHDLPKCWRGLSARVRLNDQQVCTIGLIQARGQVLCIVNTAELTSSGQRRFPNGPASFRTELVSSTGLILASATHVPLIISNSP